MFHDIHSDKRLDEQLKEDRNLGTLFDEVLYADDTIIYSTDSKVAENTCTQSKKVAAPTAYTSTTPNAKLSMQRYETTR